MAENEATAGGAANEEPAAGAQAAAAEGVAMQAGAAPAAPEAPAEQKPKKAPPEVTGISEITYPCGCKASDPNGNLPGYCPEHGATEKPTFRDRYGTVFDADLHGVLTDGTPALDSSGRLIHKAGHYNPPGSFKNFGG